MWAEDPALRREPRTAGGGRPPGGSSHRWSWGRTRTSSARATGGPGEGGSGGNGPTGPAAVPTTGQPIHCATPHAIRIPTPKTRRSRRKGRRSGTWAEPTHRQVPRGRDGPAPTRGPTGNRHTTAGIHTRDPRGPSSTEPGHRRRCPGTAFREAGFGESRTPPERPGPGSPRRMTGRRTDRWRENGGPGRRRHHRRRDPNARRSRQRRKRPSGPGEPQREPPHIQGEPPSGEEHHEAAEAKRGGPWEDSCFGQVGRAE